MFFDYVALTFLLFFITFFFDVFYRFLKHREITPRKMFTFKKGGLFEHYIIVSIVLIIIVTTQLLTGLSPFDDNIFFRIINLITFTSVSFIFLVFILVFIFYFFMVVYAKIRKIEDRQNFLRTHTHRIITSAFIIAVVFIGFWLIQGIIELIN